MTTMNDHHSWVLSISQFQESFHKTPHITPEYCMYEGTDGKKLKVYNFSYAFCSYNIERIIDTLEDIGAKSEVVQQVLPSLSGYLLRYCLDIPDLPCHFVFGYKDNAVIIEIKQLEDRRISTNMYYMYR